MRLGLSRMIWKPIPGFLDYEVSEHGDVRRGPGRLKPERTNGNGRKRFSLSKGGRLYRMKAHQLVALAFLGPPPFEGAEVCHNDGFHHNNHHSNLRWDTHSANVADDLRHRNQMRGRTGIQVPKEKRLMAQANELLSAASRP